jgi:hypothetical protein
MRKTVLLGSALVILFAAGQAKAQGGQFTLFAGYLNPGTVTVPNVREALNFRGTGLYGARAEFDFHRVLGIEENVAFSPGLFNPTLVSTDAGSVRGFLESTNLVLNIPIGHRFVPFLTGGVGFMKPWGSDFFTLDTKFAGSYGGGLKLDKLIGPVGLRFDVRGWSVANVGERTLNMLEASGGLTFSWGER